MALLLGDYFTLLLLLLLLDQIIGPALPLNELRKKHAKREKQKANDVV